MQHTTTRARAALVLIGCLALAATLPARAAPLPVAMVVSPTASFLPGSAEYPTALELAEGGTLMYTNLDYAAIIASSWGWHSILSDDTDPDGEPLFQTPLIGYGQTVTVEGVSSLPPDAYPFACQSHADMRGTLVIVPSAV